MQVLIFKETIYLGKHLGVPLSSKTSRHKDSSNPIENVKAELTNWKANTFSFAGRITISKMVIEAMTTYTMMSCILPKENLKKIQTLPRNFVWGDTEDEKHVHAVNWSILTTPKMMRGLGLNNLVINNKACILRLG